MFNWPFHAIRTTCLHAYSTFSPEHTNIIEHHRTHENHRTHEHTNTRTHEHHRTRYLLSVSLEWICSLFISASLNLFRRTDIVTSRYHEAYHRTDIGKTQEHFHQVLTNQIGGDEWGGRGGGGWGGGGKGWKSGEVSKDAWKRKKITTNQFRLVTWCKISFVIHLFLRSSFLENYIVFKS